MERLAALTAWTSELRAAFPHLSKPQVKVLAQYSLGMVLAQHGGLSRVAWTLSQLLGQSFDTVRERLRDFYCSAADKSGDHRRELRVQDCFAPLLAWVLQHWRDQHLAIALDATALGDRFVVLAIGVVYRSCAIPVAWAILPANVPGAWKPHWLRLLRRFKQIVPSQMTVIALADRGLYAQWLFEAIVRLGWHPFLRINHHQAEFRPLGGPYAPLDTLITRPGQHFAARGTLFRQRDARLPGTLLGLWTPGHEEPWWVVTDLWPDEATPAWYALRTWIERGFHHFKTGGWGWQNTRMTNPQRAERLWLVMAVASVYLLRQASAAELDDRLPHTTAARPSSPNTHSPRRRRILSLFCAGLLLTQLAIPMGRLSPHPLVPEPWPAIADTHLIQTSGP